VIGAQGEQAALVAALRQALGLRHAAVTDVSSRLFRGEPRQARRHASLLAQGCPMDFHRRRLSCRWQDRRQPTLHKVGITLLARRGGPDGFELLVRRSFIDHFWQLAVAGSQEFGLTAAVAASSHPIRHSLTTLYKVNPSPRRTAIELDPLSDSTMSKSYDGKQLVVRDLNLDIVEGEFLDAARPVGLGKTTTLMMLAGFETATSGEIYLDGRPINAIAPEHRNIGMVFQNYALFHMSVAENRGLPAVGAWHQGQCRRRRGRTRRWTRSV